MMQKIQRRNGGGEQRQETHRRSGMKGQVICSILLGIIVLGSAIPPVHAAQSFPLLCRGGGTMQFRSHAGNGAGTFNILGLFFNKGTRPAGLGLAPGQCSWLDRGMRGNEPDILQQDVPANVTSAPWFSDLRNPGKFWTFQVFNTNQGVMKVTAAHPGRRID
jgi:hypothetical protein